MLVGSYYPADPRTANCLDETGQRLAGQWVGEGSATCAETLSCVLAVDFETATDPLHPVIDCMVAADPAVSAETSDFLNCFLSSANPAEDCAESIATCQSR